MTVFSLASARALSHDRLIARLETISDLTPKDHDDLRALPIAVRSVRAGRDISRDGERVSECLLLIDGMLQRYKERPDGQRQILAFHVPGDIPDLQTLHLPLMDHNLAAVTNGHIGAIPHEALSRLIAASDGVRVAFWREGLIDAAKFRQWIANLGLRDAYQRTAHLLCELFIRLRAMRLDEAGDVALPLTQIQLSEALGISVVHVNRTLQALRKDGLIAMDRRTLAIPDWGRLREAADFDPAYLHMQRPSSAAADEEAQGD